MGNSNTVKYFLALLLLAASANAAQVADVRYTFSDFTTSPSSVRRVQITPIQGYNATDSTIITGDRRTFTNDSSGVLIVSNVVAGASYRVDLNGQYTVTSFTNTFPSGTTGLVEAVDYISVPTNAAGTVAFSMTASDLRYATPAQVTNIAQIYASGLGYSAQLGSENLTNWSQLDTNILSGLGGGGTGQTNWDYRAITNAPWAVEADLGTAAFSDSADFDASGAALAATNGLGTAAWHPAGDFYLSSNPSGYITIGDVPAQRTQWSVATVTNAGTAAYSNASAFITPAQIGTAAYSNSGVFLGLHAKADTAGTADTALAGWPTTWSLSSITDKGTAAYSNASAFYLSSNPSSYITLGDVPAQRTQWSVATVTNAGTAAYSNATAFLTPAQVGTAAYSNASAFDLSGAAGSATNKLDTDLRQAINDSTNVTFAPSRLATNSSGVGQVLTATSSSTAKWSDRVTAVYGAILTTSYSSTDQYVSLTGSTAGTATESRASVPWPVACTFTNLISRISTAPPAGTNYTITLYTNSVASSLVATIVGNGSTLRATNTTASVFVPFGTTVSIQYNGNNASASGNLGIGWSVGYFQ